MRKQSYIDHKGFSYSSLSRISVSPAYYKYKIQEDTESMNFGSAVDSYLTTPDDFNNEFSISLAKKPSGQLGEFVQILSTCDDLSTCFQLAYDTVGFKRDTLDKVKERFYSEGLEYYNEVKNSKDKKILSKEEYNLVKKVANALKTNQFTKKYFTSDDLSTDVFYQTDVYFTKYDLEFKALYDVILVDHINKVIQPMDLKTTTKSPYGFLSSYFRYRYYLQQGIYSDGIVSWAEEKYPGYKTEFLKFIVIEKCENPFPIIYNMNDFYNLGVLGGLYEGKIIKGYLELAEDLKWHKEQNLWDYPKDIYLKGERVVKLYEGLVSSE